MNLEHDTDSPSLLGKQVPGSQVLLLTTYADAWLFLCKLQGVDSGSHACRARTLLNKTLSSPIILGYYVQYDKVIFSQFYKSLTTLDSNFLFSENCLRGSFKNLFITIQE